MASRGRRRERDSSDGARHVRLRVVSAARSYGGEGGVEPGEVRLGIVLG